MQITSVEIKQGKKGPYKQVKMDGKVLGRDMFLVFPNHTRYEDVTDGRAFAPEEFEKDGEYIKLTDPDAGVKSYGGGRKGFDATAAVALKNEGIHKSQDRKEESIKVSSTARDATLILTALMSNGDYQVEWQNKWLQIRKWLLDNFDVDSGEIPL